MLFMVMFFCCVMSAEVKISQWPYFSFAATGLECFQLLLMCICCTRHVDLVRERRAGRQLTFWSLGLHLILSNYFPGALHES